MTKFATELARVMAMRTGYRIMPMAHLSVEARDHDIDHYYEEVRFQAKFGAIKVFPAGERHPEAIKFVKRDIIESVLHTVHGETRAAVQEAYIALSELGTKVPWNWLVDLKEALENIDKTTRSE